MTDVLVRYQNNAVCEQKGSYTLTLRAHRRSMITALC